MIVAISLIPYTYHAVVIKSAIRKKVNVVTTSYISPSMQELEKEIDEAGITVMNEIGLDPGVRTFLRSPFLFSFQGGFENMFARGPFCSSDQPCKCTPCLE